MSGRPFLFLATRAEDLAADDEYAAMLRFSGLPEDRLRRVRLERDELGPVDLSDWAGIILGGGPFNISDPAEQKSAAQRRAETELRELALRVVDADSPFLGACYGVGTLGTLRDGVVDRTFGEPIGSTTITLTEAGVADPLIGSLPRQFDAFLGHKEAVRRLPTGAVLLATSAACPVQAFRFGSNVYATQFHPELDVDGLITRIQVYSDYGYFPAEGAADLIDEVSTANVSHPPALLRRFVELYG